MQSSTMRSTFHLENVKFSKYLTLLILLFSVFNTEFTPVLADYPKFKQKKKTLPN